MRTLTAALLFGRQNNYIGLRTIDTIGGVDQLYVEYQTGNLDQAAIEFDQIDYIELYDLRSDTWQQKNLVNTSSSTMKDQLHSELHKWYLHPPALSVTGLRSH